MFRALAIAPRSISGAVSGMFLATGLALGLSGCGPQLTSGPAPAVQETRAAPSGPMQREVDPNRPVLVALLAPLGASDANAAATGTALANAARMALTDLNDPTMKLKVYDTRGTPEGAAAAAHAALGEGAALILGPLFGANTRAIGDIAAQAGVNVISFSTDSGVAGGPVFVSGFLPESEARRVVGFAASRGLTRIGVFYPNTGYGDAGLRGAQTAADAAGAQLVTASAYERNFQGIQDAAPSFASAAGAAGITAVLLPDSGKALQSVGAFLDYSGLDPSKVRYMGLGQWNTGATLMEPTLRGGWFPAPDPDRVAAFNARYQSQFTANPPFVAVLGYDAVEVAGQLLQEARQTGSTEPFSRAALTRSNGFEGALGPLRFTPGGLDERSLAILQVGSGGFQIVDPAPGWLGPAS